MTNPRLLRTLVSVSAAATLLLGAAIPAWAADNMTLTFVRHGESEGNASGDSTDDNPPLTALGEKQAQESADRLSGNNYDAIYTSDLVRTQQTAAPMEEALKKQGIALHGFRELEGGILASAGLPETAVGVAYLVVAANWMVGNRSVGIPGSIDGNEFDERMDGAVETVYDSGSRNAVVYSHGAAIMFWTMMNVDNPDPLLIVQHPLSNTDTVVIEGNPEDGWTLVNWNGVEVAKDPSLVTKLFVDTRDAVVAPQTAVYKVEQAVKTGNVTAIADSVRTGIETVANTPIKYVKDVAEDVTAELRKQTQTQSTSSNSVVADVKETSTQMAEQVKAQVEQTIQKATDTVEGRLKSTGTTKLTQATRAGTMSPNLRTAANDVRKQISSSTQKAGDAVRKAVAKATHANDKADSKSSTTKD